LLGKGVAIKNLGLLIIDEEQRFGVKHKEAIKKIKHLVDVLTMSATPIPRTLHMSLVGIRDLSLIQTPPRDRLPIRTYVMEDADEVLREAILREMRREGQIFFLHNRVESIEGAARRVMSLVPEARVSVLHGRMEEEEIEDVLLEFLEKKFDLLVTTTIIESGIDMPNVNTLIVDRADTFGLSQLYQIRGRVGRSHRQAYAYMLTPSDRALTEVAQKRLATIQEYQELGSGFKVAMRDLEIRGAGNIIGKEQSGDIMDVGFELYIKLLDEAVQRLRGVPVEIDVRCSINLPYDFFLPTEYIPDTRQRIEMYKRFEAAGNLEEVNSLEEEMHDRFGAAPPAADTFVDLERIRTLSSLAGFESVVLDNVGRIHLKAGDYFRVPGEHFLKVLSQFPSLSLEPGSRNKLFFKPRVAPGSPEETTAGSPALAELIQILSVLAEPVRAEQLRREAEGGADASIRTAASTAAS
jgi:transcription-repair coupling factor (superfamily II helicase)